VPSALRDPPEVTGSEAYTTPVRGTLPLMTTTRKATTQWTGSLMEGSGEVTLKSSDLGTFPVSWPARSQEPEGPMTSPEELIAAAHSTCFSMALAHGLAQAGTPADRIDTTAEVDFTPGTGITEIRLTVSADVPEIDVEGFRAAAEAAKDGCPVSQALSGVPIVLIMG
jgi:lipoyl-dependent peroxiredoxin